MSRVGEMGVGEMGIGETGVGEMGVDETGTNPMFRPVAHKIKAKIGLKSNNLIT